jgi:hypothetical protein
MKIETKFDLIDRVYTVFEKNDNSMNSCTDCAGTGTWTIKETGTTRDCDECFGEGTVTDWANPTKKWFVDKNKYIIRSIKIGRGCITYGLGEDSPDPYEMRTSVEEDLTYTEQEATLLCNIRNNDLPKPNQTLTRKQKRKQKHAKK